ncbi:MAG TPA: NAD-dependent epimerase/dehydratase family protein [Tepidisphaeraceae bacterium]|jgi:UDP-glucose 4-epimerase|nr:NAD-dependent epimerase/dehydratase family protein [Tepidisphaeraceae bacterium]
MPTTLTDWPSLHHDSFKNTRCLITGGAGFIGSHLAEALSILGATVLVLDDLSGGDPSNIKDFPNVHFTQGSILDQPLLTSLTQNCTYVFHEAALGSVPGSVADPRRYYDVNCTGTLNVLEAARAASVRRLMFAASSAAYGDSEELPKRESMPVLPKSPYAAHKVTAEALLRAYSASYGLDTVSLRYFNIFGPRQNANSAYAAVIAAFAKSIAASKPPLIYGDGEQSRDFTYVDNVVHANLLAARSPKPLAGQVINVACAQRITVNHLADLVTKILNRPDLKAKHEPERTGDVKHSLADLTKARALLNYAPIVDFAPGLEVTLKWYASVLK